MLVFLFVLNLLSGLFFFGEMIFQGWGHAIIPALSIVVISAMIAFVEYLIIRGIGKYLGSFAGYTIVILFTIIHTILLIVDSFLYVSFGQILNQDSLYVLAETNRRESVEFISTYTSVPSLIIATLIIAGMVLVAYKLYNATIKRTVYSIMMLLAVMGVSLVGYSFYSYRVFGDGMGIPQYSVLTRGLYGSFSLKQIAVKNKQLAAVCRDLHCTLPVDADTIPHVVVVIGESSSYYHCSVYDYEKPSWPCMEARQNAGELFAYRNVTTPYDATNWVMRSIFPLEPSKFGKSPIFPAVFHAAGYRTFIVENQYFVGDAMTFLCDKGISDIVFDARQDGPFKYDGEMLPFVEPTEGLTLDIIHLTGQHLAYDERFPRSFEKFCLDDYDADRYNEQQRKMIAQYDNAGLYCDYVLDQIIRKYESQDCMLVFFPDHGEEVFETRDFCGHGSSGTAPDTSYLFHIPFFVWTSTLYRDRHPIHIAQFDKETVELFSTQSFAKWLVQTVGIRVAEWEQLEY